MAKYLFILLFGFLFFSCKKVTEAFKTELVSDYMPLQIGKFITYRLDSTVFSKSGTVIEVCKYQIKHTISAETYDNVGRKTYVVQKTLNNETASAGWRNTGSFIVIPYDNKIEILDNNLKVVVLQAPFTKGFTWKGNSQLPFAPYKQLFDMTTGYDMNKWDFAYTGFGNETVQTKNYENVWTVEQKNESIGIPPTPDTKFGSKEVSLEKYAKGIGLVYKDFHLYEYQAPSSENASAHYTGFGITMWMIDHN